MSVADLGRPVTLLKDYRASDFYIEKIELDVDLQEEKTVVTSQLHLCRNVNQGRHHRPLVLQGEALKLLSLTLDTRRLEESEYDLSPDTLTIHEVPDTFRLTVVTEIDPGNNTTLSGLYRSGDLYCTQCEAEGFRRITYYIDRPDVMALFTTTIHADKARYPILLSNGNKIAQGTTQGNRHWVTWQDPFKKPAYLFALVAGNLLKVSDSFQTASGRHEALEVYVEPGNEGKCRHALESLKKAMRWDEQMYGREYDLDVYMIVAVNDFNMGAMENKGLNIFNAKYVLAEEKTATDLDFQNVEAVIGHEYFHNWTGNRITCRDWFQLSLKEGLTVFREQQFSAAMGSAPVKRIRDIRAMRTRQFAEDAGPMAHPVRPESYIEINNFYTATIYNKGAEVIRMLHTLLGEAGFRRGMDLYFERHDGQAVTIEDFLAAFSDANHYDVRQFHRWYTQAGTPEVTVEREYRADQKQFVLKLMQKCPETPDKIEKKPFLIPLKIALYDQKGTNIPLVCLSGLKNTEEGYYIPLDEAQKTVIFEEVATPPIPALLTGFSAPVKLSYPYTLSELAVLMTQDKDYVNRWDAAQKMGVELILSLMQNKPEKSADLLVNAYRTLLRQKMVDPALFSELLVLPSFDYMVQFLPVVAIDSLLHVRKALLMEIVTVLKEDFARVYEQSHTADDGTLDSLSAGHRALKNICLSYLMRTEEVSFLEIATHQYYHARNMTEKIGALQALNHSQHAMRTQLLDDFYAHWKHDKLVVNKWLGLHATSELPNTLDNLDKLLSHEAFDIRNPNKVYALIHAFSTANPERFHEPQGKGYEFLADRVITLNQQNPQVAARLLEGLTSWKRFDKTHADLMKRALTRIQLAGDLSQDVYEIVTKSLA